MNYLEIIKKALNGRSINATARAWGIQQVTLNRYANGRLPDFTTAKIIAKEAGISDGEMLNMLAEEEARIKVKPDKMSTGFKTLLRAANAYWA